MKGDAGRPPISEAEFPAVSSCRENWACCSGLGWQDHLGSSVGATQLYKFLLCDQWVLLCWTSDGHKSGAGPVSKTPLSPFTIQKSSVALSVTYSTPWTSDKPVQVSVMLETDL